MEDAVSKLEPWTICPKNISPISFLQSHYIKRWHHDHDEMEVLILEVSLILISATKNQLSSPHVSFFSAPRNITDIPLASAMPRLRSGDPVIMDPRDAMEALPGIRGGMRPEDGPGRTTLPTCSVQFCPVQVLKFPR